MSQYTKAVGQKFHKDGAVRQFPGNTIISKIPPSLPIYAGLVAAQEKLQLADISSKYVFLPPSSFHMTVIEGMCDQVREPHKWSTALDLQMSFPAVNRFMAKCAAKLSYPASLSMTISPQTIAGWLVIILEPADAAVAQSLYQFREQFSQETGIRFPNHETYTFHISLAYNLLYLTPDEEHLMHNAQQEVQQTLSEQYPIITLPRPCLTYFEDMFRFDNAG